MKNVALIAIVAGVSLFCVADSFDAAPAGGRRFCSPDRSHIRFGHHLLHVRAD